MNSIKEISIKNFTYNFFYDKIDIKIFDPNKVKIDKKSFENFLIYHIGYVIFKDLSYTTSSSVNPLCLINNEIYGYIEESNGNKESMKYYGTKLDILLDK